MPTDAGALQYLGALLTGTEAGALAVRLEAGSTFTAALRSVQAGRRPAVEQALERCGLARGHEQQAAQVLRAIEGARSDLRAVHSVWTVPGHVARSAPLTASVVEVVDRARFSVTCSTYNLQHSSGLYAALQRASRRREVQVRLYLDRGAATGGGGPTPEQVAETLRPAAVLVSGVFGARSVRNHAKFVAVDHRWLLVTSANASWSAEQANVELGLAVDDVGLTESVERQVREAERDLYVQVDGQLTGDDDLTDRSST